MTTHVPVSTEWMSLGVIAFVWHVEHGVGQLQTKFLAKGQKVQVIRVDAASIMLAIESLPHYMILADPFIEFPHHN